MTTPDTYEFKWYILYSATGGMVGTGLICERLWPSKCGITIELMDPQPTDGCTRPSDHVAFKDSPCPA